MNTETEKKMNAEPTVVGPVVIEKIVIDPTKAPAKEDDKAASDSKQSN